MGGIETQGVYRLVGVQSKVDLLMNQLISNDHIEWGDHDIRTMTGAIKAILRNFKEPILTFQYHHTLIGTEHKNIKNILTPFLTHILTLFFSCHERKFFNRKNS